MSRYMLWELTFQGPSTHKRGAGWGGRQVHTEPAVGTLHVIPGGFQAPGWDPPSWLPTSNLWARLYLEEAVLGLRLGVPEL